ncbi:MAG: phosphohistidine phosphatase [Flaviaesturariibacter sp.]|nr:phosphohistidine phosphatase [Flaviaesturariibacter sp.]
MKTLILVRHAKSSWDDITQKDFDRPLNDRGKKEAPEMAKRLKEKGIKPDLIVSSPAKRAKKTARLFAEEFHISKDDITLVEGLYEPSLASFQTTVSNLPDGSDTVAIFSHNPAITEFVNTLSNVHVDDMPTCGVFAVSIDTTTWTNYAASEAKFLFFDYPKNPMG